MNELEQRLRDSLNARAEDVEATPHLWDEVNRRVQHRAWRTGLLWVAGTAAAAAVVVAVVVVPGLLDTPDRDVVVDPVPDETPTVPDPTETEPPSVAAGPPTHVVTAGDREISLRTLDGQELGPVISFDAPEFEGQILAVAVRPGSTPDDLVVAYSVVSEGEVRVSTAVRNGDQWTLDVTHQAWVGLLPPQPVWSPDGERVAWIDVTDGQVRLKSAPWNDPGGVTDHGNVDGLDQFQLQQWTDPERIIATTEALQARALLLSDGQLVDVQPLTTQDAAVLDTATTERGVFTLLIPASDVPEEQGDAESALPQLWFAPTGAEPVELPLPDAMTIGTASPQGMWLEAQHETAVVGWGGLGWVVGRDGVPQQLPDRVNAADLLGDGSDPATRPDPDPDTTGSPGTAQVGPYLVLTGSELALVPADGDRQILMSWGADDEFKPARAEVRPGSTADELVAVVLTAGEGETELGWVEVRGGEAVPYRRFPDAHQMSRPLDGGSVSAPVWSPDGAYLGWVEAGATESGEPTGEYGLRFVGWSNGPGTGDAATDNASFGLDAYEDVGIEDLVLDQWLWNSDSEGMLTFRYARDGELGVATSTIERQPDGAIAFPGDGQLADGSVDEALTDGAVFRLITEAGVLRLAIQQPGANDVHDLPEGFRDDLVAELPPAAGPYLEPAAGNGALLFSPDQTAWYVAADGRTTALGSAIRDLDAVD